MNILADAVIAAITYISTAGADDDRADEDVRTLEALVVLLRQGSVAELDALRASLERFRAQAALNPDPHPDLLNTFRAIQTDILEN